MTSIDTVVVSILSGSFTCEVTPIGENISKIPPPKASGIFLFGFGKTDPE
jgi:hypothetical protein